MKKYLGFINDEANIVMSLFKPHFTHTLQTLSLQKNKIQLDIFTKSTWLFSKRIIMSIYEWGFFVWLGFFVWFWFSFFFN